MLISGSKLSVFQKKKASTPKSLKSPKTPKIPKTPKPPKAERIKDKKTPKSDKPKGKPGRPKGVKNKDKKIIAPQTISKEYLSSSDSDSSPETPEKQHKKHKSEKSSGSHKRDRPDVPTTAAPPPAKKVNITPVLHAVPQLVCKPHFGEFFCFSSSGRDLSRDDCIEEFIKRI